MRRVVITGLGIISSIGNDKDAVLDALRVGRSGIEAAPTFADFGFRSQVYGSLKLDLESAIDKRTRRFMSDGAAYSYLAMQQAITDACLCDDIISNTRTGLIAGSGAPSTEHTVQMVDTLRKRGIRKVGPTMAPKIMSSTVSACLSTLFEIKGVSYTISSACTTSTHCIGHGCELIQFGKQEVVFAGGAEPLHWSMALPFDAMGALSSRYNDTPTLASRAYDTGRDGFVVSGGGGMLVLEELEHARRRGARIYAEIVGYYATSDGYDMVKPSAEGAARCIKGALPNAVPIDYINTHATSTVIGDISELAALRDVFGDSVPPVSSTKSLTGHGIGAAGVHEAIYCLLMLENDFICASANIDNIDPEAADIPIVTTRVDNAGLRTVMSCNFGFGGTNGCLVLGKCIP